MTLKKIVAAMTHQEIIGIDGKLPWPKIPSDMKRFVALTMPDPMIMGRKTWDSLPHELRPLRGRRNIVVTRNPELAEYIRASGAEAAGSYEEALSLVEHEERVSIIGGGEIYKEALPTADVMSFTYVDRNPWLSGTDAVSFPAWSYKDWRFSECDAAPFLHDEKDPLETRWVTLVRVRETVL